MTNGSTIVLTYGTFDLFHVGHLRLLQRLADMGDRLIVGVSTDEFNAVKGKLATIPYADRAAIVAGIRGVDTVIAEESWNQKPRDIARYGVTHFCMGDDWLGKFDHLKPLCEIVYLERTKGVSSTKIRGQLIPIIGTVAKA